MEIKFDWIPVQERCRIVSELPPNQWPEQVLHPYSKESPLSIFGYNQVAMDKSYTMNLIDALLFTLLCESKGDARRAIKSGAIRLNGDIKLTDPNFTINKSLALINLDAIVLENGKFNFGIIELCNK